MSFTPDDATVVIVTWNGALLLPSCLDAALPQGAAVLVVDNASTDDTAALLAGTYPAVRVLTCPTNTGFAGGVAAALTVIDTPVVVLLNNDAVVTPGWLDALLTALSADPTVGAVCSKLLLPDGLLNSAGGYVQGDGYAHDRGFGTEDDGRYDQAEEVMFACGGAMAARTALVQEVGGIDPRFFLYFEDVDLSWRLWLAGYRVRYEPSARVIHEHSATTGAGSARHTFYTERNRLATLVTCASAGLAWRAVLRYPLTTLSVARGESRAKALVRVKAFSSFLRWLPALLVRRHHVLVRTPRAALETRLLSQAPPAGRPVGTW